MPLGGEEVPDGVWERDVGGASVPVVLAVYGRVRHDDIWVSYLRPLSHGRRGGGLVRRWPA